MLVTVGDLKKYMSGIDLDLNQDSAAQAVLGGVQQQLETYLGRPLEPVQVREIVTSDWNGYGWFSITPVIKVVSITDSTVFNDQTNPYTDPPMVRDELLADDGRTYKDIPQTFYNAGNSFYLGRPQARYLIEYVGGYNGWAIEGLKLDIMRVAARDVSRNHDDTLSLRGDNAEKASDSDSGTVKGFTNDELARWDRWRRRTVVR